jgi:hypothetical protein
MIGSEGGVVDVTKRGQDETGHAGRGSRERGRTDTPAELRHALTRAGPHYLEGALQNPSLSPDHVLVALRNEQIKSSQLRQLARSSRFAGTYEVRAAITNHPAAPTDLAMNMVSSLFWRDLVRVAENYRLYPPLRRRAERILAERLAELSEGEIIALARIAGRPLIGALRKLTTPRITAALLGNPFLVEEDVLTICRTDTTSPESLSEVARSDRWRARRSIRLALARNPATPIPDSLRCLQGLLSSDLRTLCSDVRVPTIVRIGAERRLGPRQPAASRHPDAPSA